MWTTLEGEVRFLTSQGVLVTVAREGELAGLLRIPYGGSPAGHPWHAVLGLLWDAGEKDYLAWYAITPDGWHTGWSRSIRFWSLDVPEENDPADHAMALVVRQIHRTRGDGTGPRCLFRVTSSGWSPAGSVTRAVREA